MSTRPRLPRRILIRLAAVALGVIVVVLAAWTPWCLWRFQVALATADVRRAEAYLDWADLAPWSAGERAFLRARLLRRLSRSDEIGPYLERAQQAGFPRERLEREVLLAQAQAGNLAPLQAQISDLLVQGEDLPAICEAYVCGCIQQYRIDEAFQLLETWQVDFPQDPQPYFLRGRLLEHQSALGEAEAEFRSALKLAPRHAPAAYNLARVLLQKQEPAQALEAYQVVADGLFEPQPGLVGIARCQRELNQWDAASETMKLALARPNNRLVEAYRYLGDPSESATTQAQAEMAQLELARGRDAEAVPWFEQALAAYPQDWKLRYTYSTVLGRVGRSAEAAQQSQLSLKSRAAMESCDRLIDRLKQNPADVDARYRIGSVLLEYASPNQGLVWLNSVLEYDPQHGEAHRRLADYFTAHVAENPEFAALAERHRNAAEAESPVIAPDK